jgi:Spy/CpxP family protein refolding chaperone
MIGAAILAALAVTLGAAATGAVSSPSDDRQGRGQR